MGKEGPDLKTMTGAIRYVAQMHDCEHELSSEQTKRNTSQLKKKATGDSQEVRWSSSVKHVSVHTVVASTSPKARVKAFDGEACRGTIGSVRVRLRRCEDTTSQGKRVVHRVVRWFGAAGVWRAPMTAWDHYVVRLVATHQHRIM